MIPAETLADLATLGLSREQADAVSRMLRSVEDATRREGSAAIEARRASEAARTARYRERGGGNIPAELRNAVFERDGYACVYCGSVDHLQCDHVEPISRGGETSLDNLATACRVCNAKKKDRDRKAFVRGMSKDNPRTTRTSVENPKTTRTSVENPKMPPEPYIARAGAPVCSNDFSNEKSKLDNPLPTVGPLKPKDPTPKEILSEVVSEKTAADVVAHRKALRKPLTPRAAELLAKTLAASGDAERAAATMIERGWQSYRADWDGAKPNARAGPSRPPEKRNTVFQAAQEMMAELYGGTDGNSERPSDDFSGTTLDLALEPGGRENRPGGVNQATRDDAAASGERGRYEGDVVDLHGPRGRFASG